MVHGILIAVILSGAGSSSLHWDVFSLEPPVQHMCSLQQLSLTMSVFGDSYVVGFSCRPNGDELRYHHEQWSSCLIFLGFVVLQLQIQALAAPWSRITRVLSSSVDWLDMAPSWLTRSSSSTLVMSEDDRSKCSSQHLGVHHN